MHNKTQISIVLPTYNGENYIKDSIESVISQSFTNWELIIVDDCSTDRTSRIIEQYKNMDTRIRIISNPTNYKLPKSLNIGFANAQGKYFTWTSDDNEYHPDALEKMYCYLESHLDCPMVVADMEVKNIINGNSSIYSFDINRMPVQNSVGACFLYRKNIAEEIGGYNENLFCVEDYDYWLRILTKYGKIGRVEEVLYLYRMHPNSLTATKARFVLQQKMRVYEEYFDWVIERIRNDKDSIFELYYEAFCGRLWDDEELKERFSRLLPCVSRDMEVPENKKIILFGAGALGKQILKKKYDQVFCFADHAEDKIGKLINGKRVISFAEMIDLLKNQSQYHAVVSVSGEKQYQMVAELCEYGISCYSMAARCLRD